MKWILAAAAVVVLGLFAAEASAQGTTPPTTTPSVGSTQTVPMQQTGRTGLFRRAQERRGRVAPMTQTTTLSTIQQTSGSSKIESIPVTPTTVSQPTAPTLEPRTGLFGRLRARR